MRLHESALSIVATRRPERPSIDDVIAASEVSRRTLCKCLDSPGGLIQELAVEVSNAVIEAMHALVESLDDVAQQIAVGVRMTMRLVRAHPNLGAFRVRAGWPVAECPWLFFVVVGAGIRKGIRQGRFVRMHSDIALNPLVGSMAGAVYWVTHGGVPRDAEEQTDAAVLRALGLPEQDAATLSTRQLPIAVIEPGTLLSRLLERRED